MAVIERITSILFSDMKGYSEIKQDVLKTKLLQKLKEIVKDHTLTPQNHCYVNTWGDGYIICSYNPVELAEIALRLRDAVENTDWQADGLPTNLQIRIALHVGLIQLTTGTKGAITNVAGVSVET